MSTTVGTVIHVGAIRIEFLVQAEDSGASVTVFECTVPANARVPAPHSHDGFDETVYGLDGVMSWTVGGELREVGPGECLCIPRGVVHGFENRGGRDVRFLAIATPGVFGPAYFRELGDVLAAAAGGPPDQAQVLEVMRRHGLTPAVPQPAV